MLEKKIDFGIRLDWITVGLFLLLITLGWLNIYSAVYNEEQANGFEFLSRYGRQLIWIFASLIIATLALIIDSKFYSSFSLIIYGLILLLLIIVLLVGTTINGSTSWIVIGPLRIQPSEFAKFATALAMAKYLSSYNLRPERFKTLLIVAVIALTPALLILMQNDTGSALVFIALFLVFYREGMPTAYILIGSLAISLFILSLVVENYVIFILLEIIALGTFYFISRSGKQTGIVALSLFLLTLFVWGIFKLTGSPIEFTYAILIGLALASIGFFIAAYKHKIRSGYIILTVLFLSIIYTFTLNAAFERFFDDYQQKRIKVLLGIESDPFGAGYNVNQSMIAIGSGGPIGKGYLQGTQTKFKFVPEQSTDFIFCTVGEEWGFIGSTIVLLLFLALIMRIIILSERQKSTFSRVYGYCVASIFFFHVAVNVGMTIGLAPVIGIPLPFFSYGGSSLWAFTLLLFIFLKLDSNRTQLIT